MTRGSRPHGRPRPGVRPVDHPCLAVNATTGASHSGDRGTAASGGDAGGREGRRGGDQTVEGLTPGTVMRTEGHGEDGRRRYRARTVAAGGEGVELDLANRTSQLDSLDEEVGDGAAELLDTSLGLGEAGDGRAATSTCSTCSGGCRRRTAAASIPEAPFDYLGHDGEWSEAHPLVVDDLLRDVHSGGESVTNSVYASASWRKEQRGRGAGGGQVSEGRAGGRPHLRA